MPNACPICGPQVELWSATGAVLHRTHDGLKAAAQAIAQGQIVAVKGLGGFHLMASAAAPDTLRLLRERKQREARHVY